jgi:hypothetical protein
MPPKLEVDTTRNPWPLPIPKPAFIAMLVVGEVLTVAVALWLLVPAFGWAVGLGVAAAMVAASVFALLQLLRTIARR